MGSVFPSPLGVIFSLMRDNLIYYRLSKKLVSVSSRSYILSYSVLKYVLLIVLESFRLLSELYSLLQRQKSSVESMKNLDVSVSSRSYILSYLICISYSYAFFISSFRLLSELYSLLSYIPMIIQKIALLVSVSSRSYILSYSQRRRYNGRSGNIWFPSPLGVIFSLILRSVRNGDFWSRRIFRLLSELYSLLFLFCCTRWKPKQWINSVSSRSYILSYSLKVKKLIEKV